MAELPAGDSDAEIKRTVHKLRKEFGSVIPIDQINQAHPEIETDEVMQSLEELKNQGLVTFLDDESVQVNT